MEELLGRQAPHSAMAEQAVIGSMLIDTRCIPDVIERLRGAEFYVKQNRDIFETIYAMFSYGQTIDPVTVLDQMKVRGVYADASTEYIAELMRITPTPAVPSAEACETRLPNKLLVLRESSMPMRASSASVSHRQKPGSKS